MGSILNANYLEFEQLNEFGTRECKPFRVKILKRHLWMSKALQKKYRATATKRGYAEANRELLEFDKRMKLASTGLYADGSKNDILQYAEQKSKRLEIELYDFKQRCGIEIAMDYLRQQCQLAGLEMPLRKINDDDDAGQILEKKVGALSRVCDKDWWRRKLRTMAARTLERLLREWGYVNKHAAMYCSDKTLERRRAQKADAAALLEIVELENQFGYSATVAELAEASVSNPENRRAELMTRIRGEEELAQAAGHAAVFYTMTLPSKYHVALSNGRKNKKFNGADPAMGQAALNLTFSRIRAELKKKGINPYGMRVVEPHHDGTPHWHLMLFMPRDDVDTATKIFRRHALREDPNEPGAQEHRFTAVNIDWSRGTAAGYISKYIAKNIVGHDQDLGADYDLEGDGNLRGNAERVEAWASTWGIRQFQAIGSMSVTAWREMRRNGVEDNPLVMKNSELSKIRDACDRGDWAEYTRLNGGIQCARKNHVVRVLNVLADEENKYGERFSRVRGIIMRGTLRIITRVNEWKIKRRSTYEKVESNSGIGEGRYG